MDDERCQTGMLEVDRVAVEVGKVYDHASATTRFPVDGVYDHSQARVVVEVYNHGRRVCSQDRAGWRSTARDRGGRGLPPGGTCMRLSEMELCLRIWPEGGPPAGHLELGLISMRTTKE